MSAEKQGISRVYEGSVTMAMEGIQIQYGYIGGKYSDM